MSAPLDPLDPLGFSVVPFPLNISPHSENMYSKSVDSGSLNIGFRGLITFLLCMKQCICSIYQWTGLLDDISLLYFMINVF